MSARAGGAVGVEVADDQHATVAMLEKQLHRGRDASSVPTGSSRSSACSSRSRAHAARGVHAPQHRMQVAAELARSQSCARTRRSVMEAHAKLSQGGPRARVARA